MNIFNQIIEESGKKLFIIIQINKQNNNSYA